MKFGLHRFFRFRKEPSPTSKKVGSLRCVAKLAGETLAETAETIIYRQIKKGVNHEI